MLTSLSKTAREYRAHAARVRALADAATDDSAKRQYLDIAQRWHDRALDYESAELVDGRP